MNGYSMVDTDTITLRRKCPKGDFSLKNKCLNFTWKSYNSRINNQKELVQVTDVGNMIATFRAVFLALILEQGSMNIIVNNLKEIQYFTVKRYFNYLNAYILAETDGHLISESKQSDVNFGTNLFQCKDGSFILSDYICDDIIDCKNDKSDEMTCSCQDNKEDKLCKKIKITAKRKLCHHLYYRAISGECHKYKTAPIIRTMFNDTANENLLKCSNGKLIRRVLGDDMVPDCGKEAEDELRVNYILEARTYSPCMKLEERPCMIGHHKCYKISDVCIYRTDKYHHIKPCRNGAHLQTCENFQCNMMFKCAKAYCIPWSFVCDGKWDCPHGYDEIGKTCLTSCLIMFKCRNTKHICLHLGNVCDGTSNCPLQDDEQFCLLQTVNCPLTCNCLLHAIHCKGFIPKDVSHPEMYLSIIFSYIMQMPKYIDIFINVTFVKVFNSKLTDICSVTHFKKCLVLNLVANLIQTASKKCLNILPLLESLDLSLNKINIIGKEIILWFIHVEIC